MFLPLDTLRPADGTVERWTTAIFLETLNELGHVLVFLLTSYQLKNLY